MTYYPSSFCFRWGFEQIASVPLTYHCTCARKCENDGMNLPIGSNSSLFILVINTRNLLNGHKSPEFIAIQAPPPCLLPNLGTMWSAVPGYSLQEVNMKPVPVRDIQCR